MLFRWTEQSIRWFVDASAYTGFHGEVAKKILPHLKPGESLCDVGCGLGRLDLELAPHLSRVLSMDINPDVIDVLNRDAQTRGITNLQGVCGDATTLTEEFDILLMSFFEKAGTMDDYLRLCRRLLIRIVNAENKGSLYPSSHRKVQKNVVADVQRELEERGQPYHLELISAEFGQPLRSRQDADQFVLSHASEASGKELEDFLSENLTETRRKDFPLFLPHRKEAGIFFIFKKDET